MTSEGHERRKRPKLVWEILKEKYRLENFGAGGAVLKSKGFRLKLKI